MSDKVSDTPRTDAFEAEHWYVDVNSTAYALWEYARTLERENAKLAAEVEALKFWIVNNGGLLNEWAREWYPSSNITLTAYLRYKLDAAMKAPA